MNFKIKMGFQNSLIYDHPTTVMIRECIDTLEKTCKKSEASLHRVLLDENNFEMKYQKFHHLKSQMTVQLRDYMAKSQETCTLMESGNLVSGKIRLEARKYALTRSKMLKTLRAEFSTINATATRIIDLERDNIKKSNIKIRGDCIYKVTCRLFVALIEDKLKIINLMRSSMMNSLITTYLHEDTMQRFVHQTNILLEQYVQLMHDVFVSY